ncbi:MAG: hypothetical protein S4CHLAM37_11320 [Chlamydiia bacterium]|nr:hypothetical protein [Chlamydiia bacterium]
MKNRDLRIVFLDFFSDYRYNIHFLYEKYRSYMTISRAQLPIRTKVNPLDTDLSTLLEEGRVQDIQKLAESITDVAETDRLVGEVTKFHSNKHATVRKFKEFCESKPSSFLALVCQKSVHRSLDSNKQKAEATGQEVGPASGDSQAVLPIKTLLKELEDQTQKYTKLKETLKNYFPDRELPLTFKQEEADQYFSELEDHFQQKMRGSYEAFFNLVLSTDGIAEALGFPDYEPGDLCNIELLGSVIESFYNPLNVATFQSIVEITHEGPRNGIVDSFCEDPDISILPPEICLLTELKELDLRNNSLKSLPERFGNLTKLTRIYMPGALLESLPECFGNLINLEILDLEFCNLVSLPKNFGNLTKLEKLDLSGNLLESLPEDIGNLTELKELYLQCCKISTLPKSIISLKKISNFSLEVNPYDNVARFIEFCKQNPGTFLANVCMKYFRKSTAELESSEQQSGPAEAYGLDVFSMEKAVLDFEMNVKKFGILEKTLKHYYPGIKGLNIPSSSTKNYLQTLEEHFQNTMWGSYAIFFDKVLATDDIAEKLGFPDYDRDSLDVNDYLGRVIESFNDPSNSEVLERIDKLDLSNCQLKLLPPELSALTGITELNLEKNQLSFLPESLGELVTLKVLSVKENYIQSVSGSLEALVALESLDVSQNRLKSLPYSLMSLKCLKSISVEGNSFTSFPIVLNEMPNVSVNRSSENLQALVRRVNSTFLEYAPSTESVPTDAEVKESIPDVEHDNPGIVLMDFFNSFGPEFFEGVLNHEQNIPQGNPKETYCTLFQKALNNINKNTSIQGIPIGEEEKYYAYMKKILKLLAKEVENPASLHKREDLFTYCLEIAKVGENCYQILDEKMMYVLRQTNPKLFEPRENVIILDSSGNIELALRAKLHLEKKRILNAILLNLDNPHEINFVRRVFSKIGLIKGETDPYEVGGATVLTGKILEEMQQPEKIKMIQAFNAVSSAPIPTDDKVNALASLLFAATLAYTDKEKKMYKNLTEEVEVFLQKHLVAETTAEKTQYFGEFLKEHGVDSMYDILEHDEETYEPTGIKRLGVLKVLESMKFFPSFVSKRSPSQPQQ